MYQHRGFTMIELILMLVILGILSAVALPRFFNTATFENRGFYTEVINAVRYAQQYAVATNCETQISFTANTYTVNIWDGGACGVGTLNGDTPNPVTGEAGFSGTNSTAAITSAPNTFTFNALGQADNNVNVSVGGYSFTVHNETGYIEEL